MPLLEQIAALHAYTRTLRADINRASRDEGAHYLKRRVSPFVVNLRYRRLFGAYELEGVAQECLSRLRQARALSIAEFFPGDQITMEVLFEGYRRPSERFVIKDVEWSKPDSYHYVAWQLTRSGQLFQRGPGWLCPSNRIHITRCDSPLPEETQRQCNWFRDNARHFIENARDCGKIDVIVKEVREQRERRGH